MMIATRLAGGNLFFAFLGGGIWGALGAARSTRIFFGGILGGGFWEHSEHSDDFSGWWGVFWIVSVGKN